MSLDVIFMGVFFFGMISKLFNPYVLVRAAYAILDYNKIT